MTNSNQSAIPTRILTPDGLEPTPYRVTSLVAAIEYEPQGVYTVARTFHRDYVLLFDEHLDRLEESARLVGIPGDIDRPRLRAALRHMLRDAGFPDAKFRITLPRDCPDRIYLAAELFQPVPERAMREGVHVVTVPIARANPVAKTTEWMTERRPAYELLPPGAYEGIMVRADGALLEGLSSNFYGVLDGVLHTCMDDVLAGITRRAVLAVAPEVAPVVPKPVFREDIPRLSEAMLSSSGRGIVPITQIDEQPVGDGNVGPVMTALAARFAAWTEQHIAPL